METLQQLNKFKEFESKFYYSNRILIILFLVSLSGLTIGLSGWITTPGAIWQLPDSYYVFITFATLILLALTFTARNFTKNLKMEITALKKQK